MSRADYNGHRPRDVSELSEWHDRSPGGHALQTELPILDCHHHLYGSVCDPHHYRIEDLSEDIGGGHRVIGTIYVEAYDSGWRSSGPEALRSLGEVEQIVQVARTPVRTAYGQCEVAAGIVSHVDMTLGDAVAEVLELHLAAGEGRLRGVRHRTATDDGTVGRFMEVRPRPRLLEEPSFRRGVAQLPRFGLSFDAWVYHPQLDEVIDLADAAPDTTIVVDHCGGVLGVGEFAQRSADVRTFWMQRLRALASRPNVFLKIGGLGTVACGFGLEHEAQPPTSKQLVQAWKAAIDDCIDTFGTKRCMFESNFPVDKQSCSYTELWNAFKSATAGLSPNERSDLFYRTACRAYRLPHLELLGDHWMACR